METARAPGMPSIAVMAEDRLWERQIRREFQELLKNVRNISVKRDQDLESIRQNAEAAEEFNKTVLAKIETLELAVAEHNQSMDEIIEELQGFKEETKAFMRHRLSDGEINDIMSATTLVPGSSSFSRALGHEDEPHVSIESPLSNIRNRPPPRAANRKSSYIPPEASSRPSSAAVANQQIVESFDGTLAGKELFKKPNIPATHVLPDPSMNNRKRPTTTRPTDADSPRPSPVMTRNRSRSLSRDFTAQAPPGPRAPKTPRLSQDRRPLMVYHDAATAAHASLGLDGGQAEVDFITAFIKGISNKKIAEQLIESMANFCQADIKEDGTTEFWCGWDDVLQGIKNAGLDSVEYGSQDKSKAKMVKALASDMPSRSKSRSLGNPYVADHPVSGGEGRELATYEILGSGIGNLSSGTVSKPNQSNARSGVPVNDNGPRTSNAGETSTRKGKGRARRTSVEKLGPSKFKATEKPAPGNGRGGRNVVGKPGPSKSKVGESSAGVVGAGAGRGGRRGLPRAAKR
ncbi:hypothetical protein BKA65DRAFT_123255 [Rhexocercosporidium sp. MPI-PUGE-AT-0058]|nr:hypothetical protein BKA65DRAFT_123255 [Rhexocercosporidium sp. MPI-PUGE-AT-0058]